MDPRAWTRTAARERVIAAGLASAFLGTLVALLMTALLTSSGLGVPGVLGAGRDEAILVPGQSRAAVRAGLAAFLPLPVGTVVVPGEVTLVAGPGGGTTPPVADLGPPGAPPDDGSVAEPEEPGQGSGKIKPTEKAEKMKAKARKRAEKLRAKAARKAEKARGHGGAKGNEGGTPGHGGDNPGNGNGSGDHGSANHGNGNHGSGNAGNGNGNAGKDNPGSGQGKGKGGGGKNGPKSAGRAAKRAAVGIGDAVRHLVR